MLSTLIKKRDCATIPAQREAAAGQSAKENSAKSANVERDESASLSEFATFSFATPRVTDRPDARHQHQMLGGDAERVLLAWHVYVDGDENPCATNFREVFRQAPSRRVEILQIVRAGLKRRILNDLEDDGMRPCVECLKLSSSGHCIAARQREIVASRNYTPIRDRPQRCVAYLPWSYDPDRRTGRERWPSLIQDVIDARG